MYDVVIIGAGIVGCAVARALSRYRLAVRVVERESDVACGASKANSGIIHAGYDCEVGTRKAALNVRGVALYQKLTEELDIPYRRNGSMVICTEEADRPHLQALYDRGVQNGVPALSLIDGDTARRLEPRLHPSVKWVLRAETAGVISPYDAAVAFAENAAQNGVEFSLNTTVINILQNEGFTVVTPQGEIRTRMIINAAGVDGAHMHNLVSPQAEAIRLQRGQYYLLDNTCGDWVGHTIFQLPTVLGKGVLVVPTVDYNILLGPTAEEPEGPYDTETTPEGLREVLAKVALSVPDIPIRERITAFAGIRAKHDSADFVINEPVPGFINALGIDSPGLSAAPAIAEEIADRVAAALQPALHTGFIPRREGIQRFRTLSPAAQDRLIRENPAYGRVVCRCETITEGEIIDAIRRPVGARNLDAIKRRTRAQMGRCQGGFCTIRLMELLSETLGIAETDVVKNHPASPLVMR